MNSTSQQLKPAAAAETRPARFVITAEVDGFPVSIEVEGRSSDLKLIIERLLAIGAAPPQAKPSTATTEKAGTPICPVHHSAMKPSKAKPGGFFCSKRMDNGEYCPEKA